MLSDRTAAVLSRHDIHYGWVIVAVAFCTMLITAGTMGLPGAFLAPLSREFGWSTASISTALGDSSRPLRPDGAVFGRAHRHLRHAPASC